MHLNDNHLFLNSGLIIDNLLHPLKKYGINYFAYQKTYADGSRICLTNRVDDLKAYLTERHYLVGNCEAIPHLYKKQAVLWSTLPQQHLYQFSREHFNIDHGITFIQPSKNTCEFYAFASARNRGNIVNFYLNNLDVLANFNDAFKTQANSLLKECSNNTIIFPYHGRTIPAFRLENSAQNNDLCGLTQRQADCLFYLTKGLTAKEIAQVIKLSPRTVEDHIERVKVKFHCLSRGDLINKALTLNFIKNKLCALR